MQEGLHLPPVQFFRVSNKAICPVQGHETDAGYDVSVVGVKASFDYHRLYHTHIVVVFNDPMCYGELYARSSLAKRGLQLANGVGIIDPSYRGELLVSLFNFRGPDCRPDIAESEYPLRCAQLVIKRRTHFGKLTFEAGMWDEHKKEYETKRGEGGFGSTGK